MFQQKSEKKSLVITIVLNTILIMALFYFGLTYFDPPEEGGIAITFGTTEVGSGNNQTQSTIKTEPQPTPPEEKVEPQETQTESAADEQVLTQENEDAPVINKTEEKKTEKKTEDKKQPEEKKVEKKPDPTPDKSTADALKNIMTGKKQDGDATEGKGDDNQAGNKGDPSGDPNSSSYYGKGKGLDGDGNYRLGGRRALNKQKHTPSCNETGIVVVEIKVNRQGEVIQARPGVRGTTNTARCLMEPAQRAAMETKFNADANAPSVQTGEIHYEFKLSE